MPSSTRLTLAALGLLALVPLFGCGATSAQDTDEAQIELLNVSYDPTRELWRALNEKFIADYAAMTGTRVAIKQSHGGSGSQARAVIEGLEADVVSLAMWNDTNAIAKAGLIDQGWSEQLPNGALPYFSTIVFVVRKGNPKGIKDWPDLVRDGVEVITPSPKTSGNGKLSLLAAWGSVVLKGGSDKDALDFITRLYEHVPVLDSAARAATTTFAQKGIGDVHITWENEAYFEVEESGGALEIVYPTISIRAEPRVAVVDQVVDRKKTREVAEAYLNFLYTPQAQKIIAQHHYRPAKPEALREHAQSFQPVELFTIQQIAADWDEAQQKFFAEGGVFDQIYAAK
jgi:sulfate transport system substrate-binding protein